MKTLYKWEQEGDFWIQRDYELLFV